MTSKIIGTGSYVPVQVVTNDDLAKIVDTNDEWITGRTGIRERRVVMEDGTSHMAAEAARRALDNAGVKPEELDLILLGTTSPDHCFPSGACEVQGALGAVNACAFDISAACSGFLFALNTMQAFIQAGIYRTGLVIGADCLSKLVDWKDRSTCHFVPSDLMTVWVIPLSSARMTAAPAPSPNRTQVLRSFQSTSLLKQSAPITRPVR